MSDRDVGLLKDLDLGRRQRSRRWQHWSLVDWCSDAGILMPTEAQHIHKIHNRFV